MTRRLCLVTGASAGIGAALARVYAGHGFDLALTARRADRLQQLAEELRLRFGVEVLVLPADLSLPGTPAALAAALEAQGRAVDVLVNNAGYGLPGAYAHTGWSDQAALLQVLLTSVCDLTHRLLPGMTERGYGRVLNVASLAGLVPGMPGHTLYGPAKAFLVKFSQALHGETLGSGVHVTALCPGFTYSEFHDVNGTRAQMGRLPSWMWQGAETVAAAGYAAAEANRAVCVTGGPNQAIAALCKIVPDAWVLALAARHASRIRKV
jgi:short-subunit dehydrogenase